MRLSSFVFGDGVLTGYSGKWAKAINQGLSPREMVVKYQSLDLLVGPYEIAVFIDLKKCLNIGNFLWFILVELLTMVERYFLHMS